MPYLSEDGRVIVSARSWAVLTGIQSSIRKEPKVRSSSRHTSVTTMMANDNDMHASAAMLTSR